MLPQNVTTIFNAVRQLAFDKERKHLLYLNHIHTLVQKKKVKEKKKMHLHSLLSSTNKKNWLKNITIGSHV